MRPCFLQAFVCVPHANGIYIFILLHKYSVPTVQTLQYLMQHQNTFVSSRMFLTLEKKIFNPIYVG